MTTILIVDDSAADRALASGLLQKRSGNKVLFATNGIEALLQIEMHIPDLVVTDLQMPDMNGLELVDAIKANYPLIPVILMTSQGSEEIAVKALRSGAASYVPKKSLARELSETVEMVAASLREDRAHSRLMFHRMTKSDSTFELPNDLSLIPPLVSHLRQMTRYMGVCNDSDRLRVGVAIEEALVNAYYHGNLEVSSVLREQNHNQYHDLARSRMEQSPYRDRKIHVESRLTREHATFVIRDEGPGFNPELVPDPTDQKNLDRPWGRGLLLIRTFMDDLHFNSSGNEVTMIKQRSESINDEEA
jgi:CheY-like chemotaxis protein/anti-sigma regulatory factor (Ser/Thr protein kinase)